MTVLPTRAQRLGRGGGDKADTARQRVAERGAGRARRPVIVDGQRVGDPWPESTGSEESVLVRVRSATGSTVVVALALLTRAGSKVVAETLAWLVIDPPDDGTTLMVAGLPPLATVPSCT